jgi:hypothetical protein
MVINDWLGCNTSFYEAHSDQTAIFNFVYWINNDAFGKNMLIAILSRASELC